MDWVILEHTLGLPAIDEVQSALPTGCPLGTRVKAKHNTYGVCEFIFLKGVAQLAQYDWVTYNADDWSTTLLAANAIGPVGIAMAAVDSSSEYGWFAIFGKVPGKAAAGFADNGNVYATATAGTVDDAIVAGDRVKNAKGASALGTPSTGLAEFEIHYPFMDDALAA